MISTNAGVWLVVSDTNINTRIEFPKQGSYISDKEVDTDHSLDL